VTPLDRCAQGGLDGLVEVLAFRHMTLLPLSRTKVTHWLSGSVAWDATDPSERADMTRIDPLP
jgi:hypothetical protein